MAKKKPQKKKLSPAMIKRAKLIRLQTYMDLETGAIDESTLPQLQSLYRKATSFKSLCLQIRKCRRCPGLNVPCITEGLAGVGDLNARVFIVGQGLDEHGLKTGIPIIGGSGTLIDIGLKLTGATRNEVFMSNVVRCHLPRRRRVSAGEKRSCLPFLRQELKIVCPELVVALGRDAQEAVAMVVGEAKVPKVLKMNSPNSFWKSNNPDTARDWVLKLSNALDKYKETQ